MNNTRPGLDQNHCLVRNCQWWTMLFCCRHDNQPIIAGMFIINKGRICIWCIRWQFLLTYIHCSLILLSRSKHEFPLLLLVQWIMCRCVCVCMCVGCSSTSRFGRNDILKGRSIKNSSELFCCICYWIMLFSTEDFANSPYMMTVAIPTIAIVWYHPIRMAIFVCIVNLHRMCGVVCMCINYVHFILLKASNVYVQWLRTI